MASLPAFDTAEDQPAGGEAMSDSELASILERYEAEAIGYSPGNSDDISAQQQQAINYYYGVMDDVPAQEGSSSVTDRTVQTVVDNALAAILKPFVASDETVSFAPRGPEDVETAEQATEYVNYVFNCDNNGFLILHDWFKDALLSKVGVVKCWWETETRRDAREVLIEGDDHAEFVRSQPDYLGEEGGVAYLGRDYEDGRVKIVNVPPEEFRISPYSRNVDDAEYAAHVPLNITRSDLVAMGFDPAIVERLPALSATYSDNTLADARYNDEGDGDSRIDAPHKANDRLALRDEYVRVDYDDDGVAELRRIVRVNDVILLNEEVERSPFAAICPVPMPHKVFGLSLADLVIEDQKINTVLWRQMLDNLYKTNNPRPVVGEGAVLADGSTMDSLADNAPGAAIFARDVSQLTFTAVPYTADASSNMLAMVRSRIEEKTGISLAGQGLDSNALRKSGQMTATEMAMIQGGKNARVEMMARIFAETGVKSLFKLILHLITTYQPRERMIRLRNKWVPVDPRGWPEMDVEISVGLGIGEKTEQIAIADSILETQAALVQSPFASMVKPENVFNAFRKKLNAGGVKNVEDYIGSPEELDQQPEQPDPEAMKAQAELQMQQAKLQAETEAQRMKLDLAREEAALKLQLEREKADAEAQLAREKAQFEAELAAAKMQQEAQLARMKMTLEAEVAKEQAEYADMPDNRPGGDLDK